MSAVKNIAFVALGAAGAVFAVNTIAKPQTSHSIAGAVRTQLDNYNDTVHPEQDRRWDIVFNIFIGYVIDSTKGHNLRQDEDHERCQDEEAVEHDIRWEAESGARVGVDT